MDCPKMYVGNNGMQRKSANDVLSKFVEKMVWKPDEVILDIGCGPGDVTSDILYLFLKNKIKQLIGVDKSVEMVEYANKTHGCSKMNFKVLDIENANDCNFHLHGFDKIFSLFCFHWVSNKHDALINMHLMLKSGGEMLIDFLLINPVIELYKFMDAGWKKYIDEIKQMSHTSYSQDEVKNMIIEAGFRIISIESNSRKYTFPDLSSFLDAMRPVDELFSILPPHLHNKYFAHVKDKIREKQLLEICPTTGKTSLTYYPITVHAIKD